MAAAEEAERVAVLLLVVVVLLFLLVFGSTSWGAAGWAAIASVGEGFRWIGQLRVGLGGVCVCLRLLESFFLGRLIRFTSIYLVEEVWALDYVWKAR